MTDGVHVVCPHCAKINRVPAERLGHSGKCGSCGKKLFYGKSVELDARLLDRYLARDDLPLVVDFWAPWCGPCHAMAPAFERAAGQIEPRARFAKINTEAYPQVASHWGIRGIPTVIIFSGGHERARAAGAMDFGSLQSWVEQHLSG